jgi:hypothetical protein
MGLGNRAAEWDADIIQHTGTSIFIQGDSGLTPSLQASKLESQRADFLKQMTEELMHIDQLSELTTYEKLIAAYDVKIAACDNHIAACDEAGIVAYYMRAERMAIYKKRVAAIREHMVAHTPVTVAPNRHVATGMKDAADEERQRAEVGSSRRYDEWMAAGEKRMMAYDRRLAAFDEELKACDGRIFGMRMAMALVGVGLSIITIVTATVCYWNAMPWLFKYSIVSGVGAAVLLLVKLGAELEPAFSRSAA